LRQGLAVTEQAVTQLLAKPTGVWSVKRRRDDVHDAYIVVSFINSTIVLSIGQTVEEVSDSGLDDKKQTLLVALLGDDSLVQVHPEAVRYIRADKRVNEWQPPGKKKIVFAAANERQVVVALSGGELMYFTLDRSNQLLDVERKDMKSDIAAVALPPVPSGSLGAKFVAVGLMDNTVRLLSLDPNNETLKEVAMQACQAQPSSLAMTHMHTSASTDSTEGDVYLFIGLQSGVMSRSLVDSVEGKLQDTRKRYLGQNPVMLHAVQIRGHPAVMALSSRSWLSHTLQGAHVCSPLRYASSLVFFFSVCTLS
jgi:splicing factor 3B subunit 3